MRIATVLAVALLGTTCLADAEQAQAAIQQYQLNIPRQSLDTALKDLAQQTGLQIGRFSERIDGSAVVGPVEGSQTPAQALKILLRDTGLDYKIVGDTTFAVFNPKDVDSIGKVEGKGRPIGHSPRCSGFSGAEVNSATTLNQTDADSAASGWTGLNWASDCADGYSGGIRVLASAEGEQGGSSLQNSGGDPGSNVELTSNAKLEEIVVTAQKREERLQDVPISISVLGGTDLDKSTARSISEALGRVPGVSITEGIQGGGPQIAVRGVTAGGPLFSGSSPIAYYLDSVPFGLIKTAIAPDSNAYDLERIEVLRGPQGTLYGASAQNGVVRVLTKDANLSDFELKARTSGSSTDGGGENYRGDLALNVPLVEGKIAARAVVGYQNMSGWIDKPNDKEANDAQLQNMRLKINAQPSDDLSIGLSAWLSRNDFGAPSQGDEAGRLSSILDESIETDFDAYGLKIGYGVGGYSISSMTGYLDYTNEGTLDLTPLFGAGTLFTGLNSRVFSQEVVVNSPRSDTWRWSIGGIYRRATEDMVQSFTVFAIPPGNFFNESESFAVFGEVSRLFLDGRLELTAGLRHFEDDVSQEQNLDISNPASPWILANASFHANSPRGVLTWHTNDHLNVYASYSEGFRSGFPQNANIPASFPPLEADNLKNYELGAKGALLGGRFRYDTAIYFIDWQDVQQTLGVLYGDPPVPVTALVNGESASGVGLEFGISAEPVENLQLSLNFSWNDLTLDNEVRSFPAGGPPGGVVVFGKGDRLNSSPEYSAGASADYLFALGGGGLNGRLSASANYTSAQDARSLAGPTLAIRQSGIMTVARTSFSIESPDRWAASIFVDNVNNEKDSPRAETYGAPEFAQRIRPRTIGLQLEYRFN